MRLSKKLGTLEYGFSIICSLPNKQSSEHLKLRSPSVLRREVRAICPGEEKVPEIRSFARRAIDGASGRREWVKKGLFRLNGAKNMISSTTALKHLNSTFENIWRSKVSI